MSSGASNFVQGVDRAFIFILGIAVFFLVSLTATMIYFVIRYSRKKNPKASQIRNNYALEIAWTIIPTILVLFMFWYGWKGYAPMRRVPADAIPVKVYGQQWSWSFEYANGKVSDELVVPLNKPVKLNLISRDVNHGLYIPAFRIKEDVIPGKRNYMWFKAEQLGDYDIFCSEYCGVRHSYMHSMVKVLPAADFQAWLEKSETPAGEMPGFAIMKVNACLTCHSTTGIRIVGPTFKGIYGSKVTVTEESGQVKEVTVDDEYIKRSIYDPNAEIVQGFNKNIMPSFQGRLKDQDIQQIIDYIKTLK
jgi:cytochrome c oxidase subunit 2